MLSTNQLIILVVISCILWYMLYRKSHTSDPTNLHDKLYNDGWRYYGSENCGWTKKQHESFHGPFHGPNKLYINCDENDCPGISGFPTWKNSNTGKEISGYQANFNIFFIESDTVENESNLVDQVVDFLHENEFICYTRDGCPWCSKQKAELQGKFRNFVDCTEGECLSEGVPYWTNGSTTFVGFHPIDKLVEKMN